MSDDEMNRNRGTASEYQPVIDRLREIATRRLNPESGETDPARLRRYEFAGSQGGQMMSKDGLDERRRHDGTAHAASAACRQRTGHAAPTELCRRIHPIHPFAGAHQQHRKGKRLLPPQR